MTAGLGVSICPMVVIQYSSVGAFSVGIRDISFSSLVEAKWPVMVIECTTSWRSEITSEAS